VIVDYQRYRQLVESEQHLLKLRLQEASRAVSARAAKLSDKQIDDLIEKARTEVATQKPTRKVKYAARRPRRR
jgi:ribosomal protein L12E/L44/L45/RPP1/RPP2